MISKQALLSMDAGPSAAASQVDLGAGLSPYLVLGRGNAGIEVGFERGVKVVRECLDHGKP